MEATGPDQYRVTLTVGIAAVKGKYAGSVTLSEKEPPQRFKMQVEGKGTGGFMQGAGLLELSEDPAGTKVTYQGDVQVGGPIASVGQRLLDGAAKMIVGQFFTAANRQLAAMSSPPSPPPGPAGEAGNAAPPHTAQSLTGAPVQLSSSRTLLQFLTTQLWEKLRRWFRR
jgi:carbon monoxide dehydrogenase subunit G